MADKDENFGQEKPVKKSSDKQIFTITADDHAIRLDKWFYRHFPDIGRSMVARWARTGQIRLDGKRISVGDPVHKGQKLRLPPASVRPDKNQKRPVRELSEEDQAYAEFLVIHKDRAAIVVNKPPGLASQGGTKTHRHLDGLLDGLCFGNSTKPKLVHRLDKDTSGVILLGRTSGSAAFFAKKFSSRNVEKVYWALVKGVPEIYEGMIDLPLAKQPGSGGEKMHVDHDNGQTAKTHYQLIERAGNSASWLALKPITGRTHQLRAHLAAIGHPIIGDGKYGGQDAYLTGNVSRKMHLHSRALNIAHPDGDRLQVLAELPEHFAETMGHLGFDLSLGEMAFAEIEEPISEKTKAKKSARAYAKDYRKARRGERRSRGKTQETGKKSKSGGRGRPAKPARTKGKKRR